MQTGERVRRIRFLAANTGKRPRLVFLLKLVVTCSLLFLALRTIDLPAHIPAWASLGFAGRVDAALALVLRRVGSLDPAHLALAAAALIVLQFIGAVRWIVLLRRWDVDLTLWQAFRLNMVGLFLNLAFPTSVGGDVVRAYCLARHSGKTSESVTSVLLTRLIGLGVLVLVGVVGGLAFARSVIPAWATAGALIAIVVASGVAFVVLRTDAVAAWSAGDGKLRKVVRNLHLVSRDPKLLFELLALSLIIQFLSIHGSYEAALAVGVHTAYLNFVVFWPIVTVVTMLPISIFGIGLRETAFTYLFGLVGIPKAASVSMSLTWTVVYLATSLIGVAFLLTLESSFLVKVADGAPNENADALPEVEA